jgi:hypothetical protein
MDKNVKSAAVETTKNEGEEAVELVNIEDLRTAFGAEGGDEAGELAGKWPGTSMCSGWE